MGRTNRGAWPLGLLGMLGLVGLAEVFLAGQTTRWASVPTLDWRAARVAAARDAPGCSVLVFGNSKLKQGVLPKGVEAATGQRCYNLSVVGGSPVSSYFLLRRALENGARPSTLVLNVDHEFLATDSRADHFAWPQLLGPVESAELGRTAADAAFLGRLVVADLLPSVRLRHDIRAAVMAAFSGREATDGVASAAYARNRRINRGAVPNPKLLGFADIPVPEVLPDLSAGWRRDPVAAHYLDQFLALAGSRGIAVYWLLPPVAPGQQTILDRARSEERYLSVVRRLAERYPHVTVVDGRRAGYPHTVFVDAIHPDRAGASALTEALVSVIGQSPGSRWVELPSYQPASSERAVEDYSQTAAALKAGGLRR